MKARRVSQGLPKGGPFLYFLYVFYEIVVLWFYSECVMVTHPHVLYGVEGRGVHRRAHAERT